MNVASELVSARVVAVVKVDAVLAMRWTIVLVGWLLRVCRWR